MIIYDNIHGYITVDDLAKSIIDTPEFKRMQNIHQTGILYMVFPSATHTRFEHSIGTYHLAKLMIKKLSEKHPELNITDEIIMLVSIAGLCHDLGHLIYSHLFDECFLKKLDNYNELKQLTKNVHHENRSCFLLNYIVNTYNVCLSKNQLNVINDLINPSESNYNNWDKKYQIGEWIFQIISNPITSIDVDKFDYLLRDTHSVGLKFSFNYSRIIEDARIIDNNICYSSNCSEDIYHMFFIRYRLHHQIYNHKAVKSLEILIIKILFEINKEINLVEYILDVDKMCLLTDPFIWFQQNNKNIKELILNIHNRNIPKLIYEDISLEYKIYYNIECILKKKFDIDKYEIIRFTIGYDKYNNPLNNIKFYNNKTNQIISDNNNNYLLFNHCYEYFYRIYCTDVNYYEKMKNIINI